MTVAFLGEESAPNSTRSGAAGKRREREVKMRKRQKGQRGGRKEKER